MTEPNAQKEPKEPLNVAMARWAGQGWRGTAPLGPIFWGGGAVWLIGFGAEHSVVYLFLLPGAPYPVAISPLMGSLLHLCEWILLGIFIWWCISVWKCAERAGPGPWPWVARGVVAVLVVANALSGMR